jgi:putative Holliday junction resolvase
MSIDYGERHIGIALSDPEQFISFPFLTIDTRKTPSYFQKIAEITKEQDVEKIIVGIPLSIDGKETTKSKKIKAFTDKLAQYVDLPIAFWDESCTTKEASKILSLQRKSIKKNKSKLDMIAASLILRDFLRSQKEI